MAPESHSSAIADGSTDSFPRFDSLESWLAIFGSAEYARYKNEAATPHLLYEEWKASQHVLGPYLYHLTLDAWDAGSSSVSHYVWNPACSLQLTGPG